MTDWFPTDSQAVIFDKAMSAVYCRSPAHIEDVFPAPGPLLKHFAAETWGVLFPDHSQDVIKLHLLPSIPKCIYSCFEFCLPG